jgi:hypothetical protein
MNHVNAIIYLKCFSSVNAVDSYPFIEKQSEHVLLYESLKFCREKNYEILNLNVIKDPVSCNSIQS